MTRLFKSDKINSIIEQLNDILKDSKPFDKIKQFFQQVEIIKAYQKKEINIENTAISLTTRRDIVTECYKSLCFMQQSNQFLKIEIRISKSLHENPKAGFKKKNASSTKLNNFLGLYNSNETKNDERKKTISPSIFVKVEENFKEPTKIKIISENSKKEDKLKLTINSSNKEFHSHNNTLNENKGKYYFFYFRENPKKRTKETIKIEIDDTVELKHDIISERGEVINRRKEKISTIKTTFKSSNNLCDLRNLKKIKAFTKNKMVKIKDTFNENYDYYSSNFIFTN